MNDNHFSLRASSITLSPSSPRVRARAPIRPRPQGVPASQQTATSYVGRPVAVSECASYLPSHIPSLIQIGSVADLFTSPPRHHGSCSFLKLVVILPIFKCNLGAPPRLSTKGCGRAESSRDGGSAVGLSCLTSCGRAVAVSSEIRFAVTRGQTPWREMTALISTGWMRWGGATSHRASIGHG